MHRERNFPDGRQIVSTHEGRSLVEAKKTDMPPHPFGTERRLSGARLTREKLELCA